jgi:hypothetical protein
MEDQDWWPYGEPPVTEKLEAAPLSPRQIAELLEYRDLFNKHQEKLKAEGRELDQGLSWRVKVDPDLSGMSAERRVAFEGQISELRSDPEVRASLRRRLEITKPALLPLLDEDRAAGPPKTFGEELEEMAVEIEAATEDDSMT